jgi:uncharacterized protein (DUF4415 family)
MSTKPEIHMPTPEEDAALTVAALSDEDNPPLTDAELATVAKRRRGRPVAAVKNVPISLRVEPAVLAAFQGGGAGWQTRMNAALREWAQDHDLLPVDG